MDKLLTQITVRFDPYTKKKIGLLAAEEEISKGQWIRRACAKELGYVKFPECIGGTPVGKNGILMKGEK